MLFIRGNGYDQVGTNCGRQTRPEYVLAESKRFELLTVLPAEPLAGAIHRPTEHFPLYLVSVVGIEPTTMCLKDTCDYRCATRPCIRESLRPSPQVTYVQASALVYYSRFALPLQVRGWPTVGT